MGAIMLGIAILITVGVTAYLVGTTIRSIQNERKTSMRLWKNFGLSLGFCFLFFITWLGHGIVQWQQFTDHQREHGEPVELGDFTTEFLQATLENWQSEFLQLFSFTVMAAVLIHKGSAESRDSDDQIQAALLRIEEKLGTDPTQREEPLSQDETLHVLPDSFEGWMLRGASDSEPEGYYDLQEEAISAGRELATKKNVTLVIHAPDGTKRDEVGSNR